MSIRTEAPLALQSQTIRGNSVPRTYGAGTTRDTQKRVVGVVLLVALAGAAAYWYFDQRTPSVPRTAGTANAGKAAPAPSPATPTLSPAAAGATTGAATSGVTPPPQPTPAPVAAAPAATPDVIDMGAPARRPSTVPTLPLSQNAPSPTTLTTPTPAPSSTPSVTPPTATPSPSSPSGPSAPASPNQTAPVRDPLATPAAPAKANTPPAPADLPVDLADVLRQADRLSADNRLVEARVAYSRVLTDPRISPAAAAAIRPRAAEVNNTLIFSPAVADNDPLVTTYQVARGDSLVKIARSQQTVTEPALIARINRLPNPDALRLGQTLKLVRGPFHAVVTKSAFRLDLYAGPAPSGTPRPDGPEANWLYIRSFKVGLGEDNSTPVATFTVKERSKLVNPFWVNPRTGEKFDADDPKNPIGERWIGLEGMTIRDRAFTGYGIHGTIEPHSIGQEMSMGCVRLDAPDIEAVYEFLMPRVSMVKIVE